MITAKNKWIQMVAAGFLSAVCACAEPTGVQVFFSSELMPKSSRWYSDPIPESEWRFTLDQQADLPMTRIGGAELPVISIDPDQSFQTLLGIGTSLEDTSTYAMQKNRSDEEIKALLRQLVDPVEGLGMTMYRVALGASDFSDGRSVSDHPQGFYSYQDQKDGPFSIENDRKLGIIRVVKLLQEVAEDCGQDLVFFGSTWSPPGWMKDSGTLIGGKLKREHFADFATYLRKSIQAYADEGIPLYAITVNNEHYFVPKTYPGCYFTFWDEALITREINREFLEHDLTTRVWVCDHNYNHAGNAIKTLNGYKKMVPKERVVDGAAFHHYGGSVEALSKVHEAHPDMNIVFTEGSKWGTEGMDAIVQLFRNWSTSYMNWVTMTTRTLDEHNQGPYNNADILSPTMLVQEDGYSKEFYKTPEFYLYGQFSKFIRPGAVRIDSSAGTPETVSNVAFRNPDGTIVVVVVNQNPWVQRFYLRMGESQTASSIPPSTVATYLFPAALPSMTLDPVAPPQIIGPEIPTGTGKILKQWWLDTADPFKAGDVYAEAGIPNNPSGSALLSEMNTRDEWTNTSITLLRGYIHPNMTGEYTFYVIGNSKAQLYLSSDADPVNKQEIAACPSWARSFEQNPAQKSKPIHLEAGQKYYIEARQNGKKKNGRVSVAWDLPGLENQTVISGKFISEYVE
ncbi:MULTISPECIES: glycoside hydrolase family 30 beta sandwich domain-containing protein [unclassified Lentimonas]|uniref:glycoside hydrolase family 30 beta sandwich domain-containing protein n=1 Tax=unclassified Lentimonas TaxID=2630993 RepID=UPI00138A3BCD|nr:MULTISPECIES: glycoside hydrolase family 30 beta sandwich domain-containing protein [unclassified Lentimonas]